MNLRPVTLAVIVGICCVFFLRTLATFLPGASQGASMAWTAIIVHLLSDLAALLFFVGFFRQIARVERRTLRQVSMLAAAGAAVALLPSLRALLQVLQIGVFSPLARSPLVAPLAPLLSALTVVLFFAVYRRDMDETERPRLRGGATTALAGAAVIVLLNLIVLGFYLQSGELRWLTQRSTAVALLSLPIVAAAVAAILNFFVAFYRYLPRDASERRLPPPHGVLPPAQD
ncbi:MAG: hypothetical protein GY769_18330 [bacterium]|nr:hypothetical protein [bacterium]